VEDIGVLNGLNEAQRKAVLEGDGPLLVLAGAGSGKTKAIAHRIAYLIQERRIPPHEIVALTFTNKAAREMRDRVTGLLGGTTHKVWLGTFHSFCAFILRRDIEVLGFTQNFTIYDETDQRGLVKEIIKIMDPCETPPDPRRVLHKISRFKQDMLGPEACKSKDPFDATVKNVYLRYQKELRRRNSLDFDDLLWFAVRILNENSAILSKYQRRFKYILVDEYQDTNRAQFMLAELLSRAHRNLFVVGDEDQSIYGWRGADISNLLDFAKHFPEARVIRLEKNYRSTGTILDAASAMVKHNKRRMGKTLLTTRERGERIQLYVAEDAHGEARFVVDEVKNSGADYRDFAVLYRTNAQSRVLEEGFAETGIPYIVLAGVGFYERKEVKDLIAYLRCLANQKDDVSFRRIVNVPPRGIGKVTLEALEARAAERGLSLLETLMDLDEQEAERDRRFKKLLAFRKLIQTLLSERDDLNVRDLLARIIEVTGYKTWLESTGDDRKEDRVANIDELLVAATEFAETAGTTVDDFLQTVALLTDVDRWDDTKGAVALMTMHSAKGLEFPAVFIVGLEEGLSPHHASFGSIDSIEEERRLCYVAATRAKDMLYLTRALRRPVFGTFQDQVRSRFLNEIPGDLLETRDQCELTVDESDPSAFAIGRVVSHEQWGTGVVLHKVGKGDKTRVRVRFDRDGTKRDLVIRYSGLRLV
jgi:DNA helicase-2/ATP-dependent DNA helicase PcrA